MPTYEYTCAEGHSFERFQKISDARVGTCPTCGAVAERKISGGQGLIFKGSGFYITDYGKDGKGPRKSPDSGDSKAPKAKGKDVGSKSTDGGTKPAPKTKPADSAGG